MTPSVASVVPLRKESVPSSRSVQGAWDFNIKCGRPLCSLSAAMTLLDLREDPVLELIYNRHLEYAWDIRSVAAKRSEPRILVASVRAYMTGFRGGLHYRRDNETAHHHEVINSIFLHSRPHLRLSEIYDAFSCSSQHALTLWREGLFGPTRGAVPDPSVQRISPIVPRHLVLNFLNTRRMPL